MSRGRGNVCRPAPLGELACLRPQRREIGIADRVGITAAGAMFEFEPGQEPALRPVLEREHGIGDTEIDQGLRPNDRARTSRTIDHDLGVRIGRYVPDAQDQFANGRPSTMTKSSLAARMETMSWAETLGVCRRCSTSSPNTLLGTLTPA